MDFILSGRNGMCDRFWLRYGRQGCRGREKPVQDLPELGHTQAIAAD